MLVIRRHEGQTVLVGEDVEILIIECGDRRVKLGFRAPRQVAVTRGEVKLTKEQNLAASQPVSPAALSEVKRRLPVLGAISRKERAGVEVAALGRSSRAVDTKVHVATDKRASPPHATSSTGVGEP